MSPGEREGQCTVILNADTIFAKRNPCKQMWRTTLHELVHAYLYLTSDGKLINDITFYDHYRSFRKHHGWNFCWLLTHVHQRAKEYLNIRLLTGHDRDRIFVHDKWKFISKDAIRLDRMRLDRRISDSRDTWQLLLGNVTRFRSRSEYYEGLPLGSSQPGGALHRGDNKDTPPRFRGLPHGLEKVTSWFS